jgi:hypothetical protein
MLQIIIAKGGFFLSNQIILVMNQKVPTHPQLIMAVSLSVPPAVLSTAVLEYSWWSCFPLIHGHSKVSIFQDSYLNGCCCHRVLDYFHEFPSISMYFNSVLQHIWGSNSDGWQWYKSILRSKNEVDQHNQRAMLTWVPDKKSSFPVPYTRIYYS